MADLFTELKRRNVFRVGVAYAIVAWLLVGGRFRPATDLRSTRLGDEGIQLSG